MVPFISLQKVQKESDTDYILKVKSTGKALKERSMKSRFDERFMDEIKKINTSLTKKHGVKKIDKVNQRIGRAVEKYPSAAKFYNINIIAENDKASEIVYEKKKTSAFDDQELRLFTSFKQIFEQKTNLHFGLYIIR